MCLTVADPVSIMPPPVSCGFDPGWCWGIGVSPLSLLCIKKEKERNLDYTINERIMNGNMRNNNIIHKMSYQGVFLYNHPYNVIWSHIFIFSIQISTKVAITGLILTDPQYNVISFLERLVFWKQYKKKKPFSVLSLWFLENMIKFSIEKSKNWKRTKHREWKLKEKLGLSKYM